MSAPATLPTHLRTTHSRKTWCGLEAAAVNVVFNSATCGVCNARRAGAPTTPDRSTLRAGFAARIETPHGAIIVECREHTLRVDVEPAPGVVCSTTNALFSVYAAPGSLAARMTESTNR